MRIAYDYQIFGEHQYGGVSRYFFELASTIARFPGNDVGVVSPLYVNEYLAAASSPLRVLGRKVPALPRTGRIYLSINRLLAPSYLARFQPDLVHETYYLRKRFAPVASKVALTVFDMIHERCPETFGPDDQMSAIKAAAIGRADHLFCISEHTKRDLIEILGVAERKITVTYLAVSPLPAPSCSASSLVGSSPYLLHVGGRQGYKNFPAFLRAYAASPWLQQSFRVVCFGSGALTALERALMAELGIPEASVIQVSGGDDVLAAFYQGAAALVYPSQYEGFGIPPLEAMSQGCPVICSRATSIPEVVGEAGAYFDPQDVDSIRDALEQTLQSESVREGLIEAGHQRSQGFSWDRCARETLSAYRELLQ